MDAGAESSHSPLVSISVRGGWKIFLILDDTRHLNIKTGNFSLVTSILNCL